MKEFIKSFWDKFREIFGLKRNDKYVRNYLNEANMRSGVFMAAIIFALEMWLLVRQTNKYILPSLSGVNDFPGFLVNNILLHELFQAPALSGGNPEPGRIGFELLYKVKE